MKCTICENASFEAERVMGVLFRTESGIMSVRSGVIQFVCCLSGTD